MKNIQKEKAIIESFAKNFNKIKRLDEQEVDEINIAKGLASLGMAAALSTTPNNSFSQNIQTKSIEKPTDLDNISQMSNEKAAMSLLLSYTKNPFSADIWSKLSKDNLFCFGCQCY